LKYYRKPGGFPLLTSYCKSIITRVEAMKLRHKIKIMETINFEEKTEQIKVQSLKQTQDENTLMCEKISSIIAEIVCEYDSFFDDKWETERMWAHFAQMRVFNIRDAYLESEAAYFAYSCFWEALFAAEKFGDSFIINKLYEFN